MIVLPTRFGEILSGLRQERGLSQRRAASELDISQALLSHYENGTREPGLDFVCRVCDYYRVSADYLLGRSDSPGGSSVPLSALEELADSLHDLARRADSLAEELSK